MRGRPFAVLALVIAAIPAAAAILAVAAGAQVEAPRSDTGALHVHVNLVYVPVRVVDGAGAPVRGLRGQDFTLKEDGHRETIRLFEENAARPLSVVLAIDTSLSVRKDLPVAKQAAFRFAHSFLRPGDQLELIGFAGEVTEFVPFTGSLRRIDRGLVRLHGDGPTALYAAVVQAAKDLKSQPGRRVMVVISDGSNSLAGVDYREARAAALDAQASIESIILVPIDASAGRDLGGEHALIQLSRDTGGEHFYVRARAGMQKSLSQLSTSLRAEYLLGYYPVPASSPAIAGQRRLRRIQVRMTNPALDREYRLQYRAGYYAAASR